MDGEINLNGPATASFGFKMSQALRDRLGDAAKRNRRTVGDEVVMRLIESFENNARADDDAIPASPVAKAASAKANANEAKIAALEARVAELEKRLPKP